MKQFLRFQISGLTCILWTILFLVPYIDLSKIDATSVQYLAAPVIGAIALGLALGTTIHQVSITLLSPFRTIRFFNIRKVLNELKKYSNTYKFQNSDKKNQSYLVFNQAIKISWGSSTGVQKELDVEHIRDEISNRYSYYYVRIDNGLIAPLFGFALFLLIKYCLIKANLPFMLGVPNLCPYAMPSIAIIYCILMVSYVPILLREVDDIERLLLDFQDNH